MYAPNYLTICISGSVINYRYYNSSFKVSDDLPNMTVFQSLSVLIWNHNVSLSP